jgi:hypothetical protein
VRTAGRITQDLDINGPGIALAPTCSMKSMHCGRGPRGRLVVDRVFQFPHCASPVLGLPVILNLIVDMTYFSGNTFRTSLAPLSVSSSCGFVAASWP